VVSSGVLPLLRICALLAALCGAASAIRWSYPPGVPEMAFSEAVVSLQVAGRTLSLELLRATSGPQQQRGLMYVTALGPDQGMVFLNPAPTRGAFWMAHTEIALDIVFFGRSGRIVDLLHMQPCRHTHLSLCQLYRPAHRYLGAIEMRLGWFAAHGFGMGSRVRVAAGAQPN
jgi:uncharacterized membrane protein (UPF0127 family)